jgi:hypothetical protein
VLAGRVTTDVVVPAGIVRVTVDASHSSVDVTTRVIVEAGADCITVLIEVIVSGGPG